MTTAPRSRLPVHWQAQARLDTPLGPMTAAASAQGLCGLWFDDQAHHPGELALPEDPDHPLLRAAARALALYFDGYAPSGDAGPLFAPSACRVGADAAVQAGAVPSPRLIPLPPLDLRHGTPFQQAVWRALQALPWGATATYGQIASAAGSPAAVRAAGAAIGRNPVSLLVPCHRVLGSGGQLTGYAGGLPRKHALLRWEGALPAGAPPAGRPDAGTLAGPDRPLA